MSDGKDTTSPLLPREAFIERFGGVYEHSPWIAAAAHDAGLPASLTAESLSAAMRAQVEAADEQNQLALLRAHPDLAGRVAVGGELTGESRSEQAGAGLDRCSADEFRRFTALNDAYTGKFGFPFILAVKGYRRGEILSIFERRLGNDRDSEFREALDQVHRIAFLRLRDLCGEG